MATVLLSAAGSAAGGALGGSILGIGAATIGQTVGAVGGAFIDQQLLGSGAAAVDTGRAPKVRLQTSTEGAAIDRVFGRMRVAGQLIWSTRFLQSVSVTTTQGTKTSPARQRREYSYSISFAVGLCEGPVDRIGRVWADGHLLNMSTVAHWLHKGTEDQQPEPQIEAIEGTGQVPAYRGLAYVAFFDLDLTPFGNRIPQLNFEVFRSADVTLTGPEAGTPVRDLVEAVALSPGTGEFSLDPVATRVDTPSGGGSYANINNVSGQPDMKAALDQMAADLPQCRAVSLIVSWFGTDLRAGHCRVEPRIEEPGRAHSPEPWTVAGLTTTTATPVSRDAEGRVNFGGTPDDGSVIRAITELNARGQKVMLYPFLLMDIPAGNGLPDPYGRAEQPPFPWRGRITLDAAPGQPGTVDKTPAASASVDAFFGTAVASDFVVNGASVVYSGPAEWTWRRFVLHLAALGAAAGGVDSICIGTELRDLTTIRSGVAAFPAVDQLRQLAAEVRQLLPGAEITYAADWSEYFGYHPKDGSGDVLFHLDPLWADPNIDCIGIDDYTPLSDWRHGTGHADAAARSVYSLPYLRGQVESGEHYDWYYADEAGAYSQTRLPITDGAYGEPWVFRPKDIRGWWENPHYNRIGGVRDAAPTPWVARSKPVWLTETGCPATDLGANKPNLFYDPKSSESGLPTGSYGARDDEMQRRFLQAKLGYWSDLSNNPYSASYGGHMIPPERIYVWTWDVRPWPDFPVRESVWSDGPAHRLGHWITGRVTAGSLAEVVTEICLASGLSQDDFDVTWLFGSIEGYRIERTGTARQALQPLMQAYGFDAFESGGRIIFASRNYAPVATLSAGDLVPGSGADGAPVVRETGRRSEIVDTVRLSYVQSENDYRVGAALARLPGSDLLRIEDTSLDLALSGSRAQQIVDRWLTEAGRGLETAEMTLPPSALGFEPGDAVAIDRNGSLDVYRIDRITDSTTRSVEMVRTEPGLNAPQPAPERSVEPQAPLVPGPTTAIVLDLPLADGPGDDHQPLIAVRADPWPGEMSVYKSADGTGFSLATSILQPAVLGLSAGDLAPGAPDRWQRISWDVHLPVGSVSSESALSVLNGSNALAVERPDGTWEIVQFRDAVLIGQETYRLSMLLRGQRGSGLPGVGTIGAGARLVLLNGAPVPLPLEAGECGLSRIWRIGPSIHPFDHESFVEVGSGGICTALRPVAPAHLRARRTGGDFALSWVRTERSGAENFEAFSVPLADDPERWRVRVRQGGAIVRTAETGTAGWTYTAAEQAADAVSGPCRVGVARLSAIYGYGPEREVEINV